MELRSAARADNQIYVIGLDVGGMAMEVAQRGLSSMLSNRMPQLGRWSFDAERPTLRVADDLIALVSERERSSPFDRAVVGLAAPAWLGHRERTDLADAIDQHGRQSIVACSTTSAAVVGTSLAASTPLRGELVLCVDLDVGISASIVEIGVGSVREWCTIGLSPQHLRGENVGRGIVPAARQRDRALAELHREAIELGRTAIDRVVAVGDEPVEVIEAMLSGITSWSGCPVGVLSGRSAVARGAAFIADPDRGLEMFGRGRSMASVGQRVASTARGRDRDRGGAVALDVVSRSSEQHDLADGSSGGWVITGSLGRRIGVLMDDAGGMPLVHPVVERGAALPSVHEQIFDLGPDDGSEVFLDLHEQDGFALSDDPAEHHVFATAHLRRGARRRAEATVTFELGVDGRFTVGPADVWTLSWRPAEVDVRAVERHLIDPETDDKGDRVMIRPMVPSWTVSRAVDDVAIDEAAVEVAGDAVAIDEAAVEVTGDEATGDEAAVEVTGDEIVVGGPTIASTDREIVPPRVPAREPETSEEFQAPALIVPITSSVPALVPTPAIATALQRCERLLSFEVEQMVAVRSVFALFDCGDGASAQTIEEAATRLEASMSGRVDDLAEAIRSAVSATRRSIADGADDWYFGGTLADVTFELSRVVEHLMVVVGLVSAAEQRRLMLDAQLLGLDPEHAGQVVRDLVVRAQADRFQAQLRDADEVSRLVSLHPELGRFVLAEPADDVTRAGVRIRVLLNVI